MSRWTEKASQSIIDQVITETRNRIQIEMLDPQDVIEHFCDLSPEDLLEKAKFINDRQPNEKYSRQALDKAQLTLLDLQRQETELANLEFLLGTLRKQS